MGFIWNKKKTNEKMTNDAKSANIKSNSQDIDKIKKLEKLNLQFINSLTNVVEPFIKKLETIHRNKIELNADEKINLNKLIDLLKTYSSAESTLSNAIKAMARETIINDINHELAIVMMIASNAEKGKVEELYSYCEALKASLLNLENEFVLEEKKLTA
ncbi:MAG: hypothetical protein WC758_00435 [Candidatus Woesearchaeota archaeon]|jgi:hypothetical protein